MQATDSAAANSSNAISVIISAAAVVIGTPSPLPAGTVGAAYSQTFLASGGTPGYSWSVSAGALPDGLTLSAAGVLAGTPTASGTFNFTVQATDSAAATAGNFYSVVIALGSVAPVIVSPVSTGAQNFTTGILIPFIVVASDAGPLTYLWNWGDNQMTAGLNSESHSFGSPGSYLVSVTVTNVSGASVVSSIPIVVSVGGAELSLDIKSIAIKLKFPDTLNKDSLILRATVQLSDGFKPGTVEWIIGGVQGNATLNAAGSSPKSSTLKVTLQYQKPAPGQPFTARPGTLTISLAERNLGSVQLAGIPTLNVITPVSGSAAGIDASVRLNGTDVYSAKNATGIFTAKKSGATFIAK